MSRPLVEAPSAATLRKRKQMQRRKAEGRKVVLLTPVKETLERLTELAELTGGTVKGESEMIVRRGVVTALQEARDLAAQIGGAAKAAQAYLPYARFLKEPDARFRVHDREMKAEDWHPIAAELGAYHAKVSGWGGAESAPTPS